MKLIIFAGFSDILILILESDFIVSWKRIWKFEMSGIFFMERFMKHLPGLVNIQKAIENCHRNS